MKRNPSFVKFRGGKRAEVWRRRGNGWWRTWSAEAELRAASLPRSGDWVPVLLRSEDRKMLETLAKLKGKDASSVVRQLIAREHENLSIRAK